MLKDKETEEAQQKLRKSIKDMIVTRKLKQVDLLGEHDLFKNQCVGSLTTMSQLIGIYKKSYFKKEALTNIYKLMKRTCDDEDDKEASKDYGKMQKSMIEFSNFSLKVLENSSK